MRFGLIGTGYWAGLIHAPGLQAHPHSDLAGVWGRSAAKAQARAAELGVRAYAELEELLDDVEAVAIAVPPNVQAEIAVRAAARGRHLLLDKPLALDSAAAQRVVDAVEAAGVRAAVFFTMRYTADIVDWLQTLPAGGWYAGRVRIYTSIFDPGNPYAGSQWRRDKGALWDIAPHALSITLPILGAAEAVIAQRGLGDAVDIGIRHASGATSTLSLSLTAPSGAQGDDWQFFGAETSVRMPEPPEIPVEAYAACVDDLTAAVRDGRDTRCGVRFAAEVVRVIEAAQAALDGR